MQPLVSIIIPLYNAEKFISQTLESALKQSYKNIEIIVIDDGSKDSSYNVACQYKSKIVTVVKQPNKGASAARNNGLSLAKGDYIQYLDADDILHPDKIRNQIEVLQEYSDLHLIGCNWRYFNSDINSTYKTMPFILSKSTFFERIDWLLERPYMIPHTWLVSKRLTELAGKWDETLTLNDDGEYFYRIIAASAGIIMENEVLAYYRAGNPNSLSTQRTKKAMISWLSSIKSYKKIMFSITGNKANIAVDRSLFEVSYHCLNVYPDLAQAAKSEMYNPAIQHNLYDNLVFNLSKIVGLSNAKKTRVFLTQVRNTSIVNYIFIKAKRLLGREIY